MLRCTSEFELTSSRLALGGCPFFVTGVHEVRKYMPRRGSTSPPRRTAGREADTEGDLPPDKGDRYVDLNGTSHEPERRANHAELAWARAEVKRLRVQLETLRGRSRARALGARV